MTSLKALYMQEMDLRVCPLCLGKGKCKVKNRYLDACPLCARDAELEYQIRLNEIAETQNASRS